MTSMTFNIGEVLLAARMLRPYYGRAITSLTPVEKIGLGTVAVDAYWRLYYDPVWLGAFRTKQQAGVIACHEIEHLLRDHASRRALRDPKSWNCAADLEINSGQDRCLLPPNGLFPESIGVPQNLLAEEYYNLFTGPTTCGCGSGAGGEPVNGELSGDGGIQTQLAEQIRDHVAADVKRAQSERPGSVPAGVVMWAEARAERSKTPWPRLLASLVRQAVVRSAGRSAHITWARPSARAWARGVCAPEALGVKPKIVVIVDTSGSMEGAGRVVLGEIRALAQGAELVEICCDAKAHKRKRGNRLGGGGTDLRAGFEMVKKEKVAAVVVISDCETPWPESCDVPVIVARVGNGEVPSWATCLDVGEKA